MPNRPTHRQSTEKFWLNVSFFVFHPATRTPLKSARWNREKENQPEEAHSPDGTSPPFGELLRKEVIQPHLPVRLPCYDFVPIASPTFDSSLHKGWAAGFGCYQLS